MKRTAFLQALVLFVLLASSWLLLVRRFQETPPADEPSPPAAQKESLPKADERLPPRTTAEPDVPTPSIVVPARWYDWWAYLASQSSPADMRAALNALRNLITDMPPEDAVPWLLEFLESGIDLPTGLAFQPGPGDTLRAFRGGG